MEFIDYAHCARDHLGVPAGGKEREEEKIKNSWCIQEMNAEEEEERKKETIPRDDGELERDEFAEHSLDIVLIREAFEMVTPGSQLREQQNQKQTHHRSRTVGSSVIFRR